MLRLRCPILGYKKDILIVLQSKTPPRKYIGRDVSLLYNNIYFYGESVKFYRSFYPFNNCIRCCIQQYNNTLYNNTLYSEV